VAGREAAGNGTNGPVRPRRVTPHTGVVNDGDRPSAPEPARRYPTPTGAPCPRTVRVDGSVEGSGACLGCGTCLLFGELMEGR